MIGKSVREKKSLLQILGGETVSPPPVWLMRQAGRYLPEYRALREKAGGFLPLCMTPEWAAEVTLQPISRFGFDAAILFSDILIVPYAMGQDLWFEAGEGPRLAPALATTDVDSLIPQPARLESIYKTVALVKARLPETTSLIGFAGSPWTVATYMIAGQGSRDHASARLMVYSDPQRFSGLIERIISMTVDYLAGQVAAGAEALMLFDSWAGVLPPSEFERWVIAPNATIVAALRARGISVPIIGFPRGAGLAAAAFAREVGVQGLGVEEQMDVTALLKLLPEHIAVQGNLDTLALKCGGAALDAQIDRILSLMAGRPHIFNLGHGITPDVPIAHVEQLLARVRKGH
jgi:uroporphyrinogen decarboxylase